MLQWYILLPEKVKLFNFIIYSKEVLFFIFYFFNARNRTWKYYCHIWSFKIFTHDTCKQNGYHMGEYSRMVSIWSNVHCDRVCGIQLAKGKNDLKGQGRFYVPWSREEQVDRHKLQGHSEISYLTSQNIDDNCWKIAHRQS